MAGSGRLGDVSLFGSSVPAFQDEAAQGPKGQMKVADVPLESEVGVLNTHSTRIFLHPKF